MVVRKPASFYVEELVFLIGVYSRKEIAGKWRMGFIRKNIS